MKTRAWRQVLSQGAVVLSLLISACGSSSSSPTPGQTATHSAGTPATAAPKDETAAAKAMLLKISDFPTGWASSPGTPIKDPDKCSNKATLPHRTASVDSDDFSSGNSASISESIAIFDSVDAAKAVLANAPQAVNCGVQRYNSGEADTSEITIRNATVGQAAFPSFGDDSQAFRAKATAKAKSGNVQADVYIDVVSVRVGRVILGISAQDVLSPIASATLQQIVRQAVAKINDPSVAANSSVPPNATETPKSVTPQPLAPSALLAGNAAPAVPNGASGEVVVAVVGRFRSQSFGTAVPVIIRNNTSKPITQVELSAGAKDAAGRIIGSGSSQGFHPGTIRPGEAALGFVYFQTTVPPDSSFAFSFQTSEPSTSSFGIADLNVTQANATNGHITGGATNATGKAMQGPFKVDAFCFDPSGRLVGEAGAVADGPSKLGAGGTVTFDVVLFGLTCPQFLVGASGYYE